MDNSNVFTMKLSKVYPLMQRLRYFDKLVDELAKGTSMEKILRK